MRVRVLRWEKKYTNELRRCFSHEQSWHQPFFSTIRLGSQIADSLNPEERVAIAIGRTGKDAEIIGLARVRSVEKRTLHRLMSGEAALVLNIGPKTKETILTLVPRKFWNKKRMNCHFLTLSVVVLEPIERRLAPLLPKHERKLLESH